MIEKLLIVSVKFERVIVEYFLQLIVLINLSFKQLLTFALCILKGRYIILN